jgi:hypothetical protein
MRENGLAQVHVNVATSQKLVGSSGLFAGKPAPTGFCCEHKTADNPNNLWERACPRRGHWFQHKWLNPETQNANPKVGVLFSSSEA